MRAWYMKLERGVTFCLGSMAPGTFPFARLQPRWLFLCQEHTGRFPASTALLWFLLFSAQNSCCWSVSSFRCHLMLLPQSDLPPQDGACLYLPRGTFPVWWHLLHPFVYFSALWTSLFPLPHLPPATCTEQTSECGHLLCLPTTATPVLGEPCPGGRQTSNIKWMTEPGRLPALP